MDSLAESCDQLIPLLQNRHVEVELVAPGGNLGHLQCLVESCD